MSEAGGNGTARLSAAGAQDGAALFRVDGALDFNSVPVLHARSAELFSGSRHIIVDLAGVTHANSAGLALLLEWRRQAQRAGVRLAVRNVPRALGNLAAISELVPYLPDADST